MKVRKLVIGSDSYPAKLAPLPSPPQQLFCIGTPLENLLSSVAVAIVGSRRVSSYGRAVTSQLAAELAEQGIVIVSGLALGVDGLAHQAALETGGKTIAVLPAGLDQIYPASHRFLAKQIIRQGGALVTEYPDKTEPSRPNFIARNRIVSGLSDAVLITEAAERSGTLHTAQFALEQGKDVMAVPGNITSHLSIGTNTLIKGGAVPITSSKDVFHALGIDIEEASRELVAANREEYIVLELLKSGEAETDILLIKSSLEPAIFNQTLTMLEISGKIKPLGSGRWSL